MKFKPLVKISLLMWPSQFLVPARFAFNITNRFGRNHFNVNTQFNPATPIFYFYFDCHASVIYHYLKQFVSTFNPSLLPSTLLFNIQPFSLTFNPSV